MTLPATSDPTLAKDRTALRRWMQASIVAVLLALVVGGITRLTDSGLSITEWKPIAGVLPPLTETGWQEVFAAYQRIPQAQTTHAGITLDGFKAIYWWEWIHRLVARGVGLVFALPYLWFLFSGRIPRRYRLRLAALPLLTLAQGALGWYMVASGLGERSSVSAYRLAAHLALALAILVAAVWTRCDLLREEEGGDPGAQRDPEPAEGHRMIRQMAYGGFGLVSATIIAGAFVAGLDAGRIFNTFPLMGGQVVPEGYSAIADPVRNAFENPIAAQFHHRVLAIITLFYSIGVPWLMRRAGFDPHATKAMQEVGRAVVVQAGIGVVTLLLAVPVWAGVLHQFVGAMVLGAATVALHAVTWSAGRAAIATSSRT